MSISDDDQRAFKSSCTYAEVVARGDGRFFYPVVKLGIESRNSFVVKQVDTVLCRYGGVEYKNGALLNLRLMTLDLGGRDSAKSLRVQQCEIRGVGEARDY